jgi:signal peptidase I
MDIMNEAPYGSEQPQVVRSPEKSSPEPKRSGFWSEIIKFTFITLLIVIPFRIFIAQPFIVSGASMDPTFADGEYLIVDQVSKHFGPLERESVVIFRYPEDQTKFFIKRVIGLPGETVEIHNGTVTVWSDAYPDGLVLDEPYIANNNIKIDNYSRVLNNDEYFVLGDNRAGSLDSRAWGPVPKSLIIGRPILRLLPTNQIGFLPGDFSK